MPISAVLANNEIMECITPGTHGSTYGGNPLASVVATESLKVLIEENLSQNSKKMGKIFREGLESISKDFIIDVRGRGLMNAIEFENSKITEKISLELLNNGLLTKSTHDTVLRLSPPLIINEEEILESIDIIKKSLSKI